MKSFLPGFISADFVRAISWTLIHSLWQALLAAALSGIIITLTRRSKALLRYNLLAAVFMSFVIASFFTFLVQPGIIDAGISAKVDLRLALTGAPGTPQLEVQTWLSGFQKATFLQSIRDLGNRYSVLLTSVWAFFFFFNFLKMLSGLRYTRRLQKQSVSNPPQIWKERLYTLVSLLGIKSKVRLKESAIVKVPVVLGFFKPVILVPLGMFAHLSAEQVEAIFIHELAHIRRKDFAVNLLQHFTECIFFFNPFILWVSAMIREEREACCDDIVLEYTIDKKSYLEALVSFREPVFGPANYSLALGSRGNLLTRVKRILTKENKKLNNMEKTILMVVVIAITAFGFIPDQKTQNKKEILKNSRRDQEPQTRVLPSSSFTSADTMPAGKTGVRDSGSDKLFSSISASNDDDGKMQKVEVTAIRNNGKKYHYKTVNEQLTELSIDGKPVPKKEFDNYESLITEIEFARARGVRNTPRSPRAPELTQLSLLRQQSMELDRVPLQRQISILSDSLKLEQNPQLESKLQLLKTELSDMLAQQKLTLQTYDVLQKNELANQNLSLLNNKQVENNLLLENNQQLENKLQLLRDQQLQLQLEKPLELTAIKTDSGNEPIHRIIDQMIEGGLTIDRTNLSFTLDKDGLILNGKKVSGKVAGNLKAKYIKGSKDHYIYKTNEHTTFTDIVTD